MISMWLLGLYLAICLILFGTFVLVVHRFKKGGILDQKVLSIFTLIVMGILGLFIIIGSYFILTGTYGPKQAPQETIIYL